MMQFKLKETKIKKLLLVSNEEKSNDLEESPFDYTACKVNDNNFNIIFNFRCEHREGIYLRLQYQATFETNEALPQSLDGNKFIYINAPAIAYPFLRASVANIFLQSGYSPIMLPSINFQRLGNKKIEKMKEIQS